MERQYQGIQIYNPGTTTTAWPNGTLTDDIKLKICSEYNEGKSVPVIAADMKLYYSTVYSVLKYMKVLKASRHVKGSSHRRLILKSVETNKPLLDVLKEKRFYHSEQIKKLDMAITTVRDLL